MVRHVLEVGAVSLCLLPLNFPMGILFLTQFHRLDCVRLICLNSQDRDGRTDEHHFAQLVDHQLDLVGQIGVSLLEANLSALRVLEDNEGSLLDIDQLTAVDVRLDTRLTG